MVLIDYLDSIKSSTTKCKFSRLLVAVEDDIKFNRIGFNKKTTESDVIDIVNSLLP